MNKMVKMLMMVGMCVVAMFTMGCQQRVPAGHVAIKVDLYGSDKGVENQVYTTGMYWAGWNTEWYVYPVFTQNKVYTKAPEPNSPDNQEIPFQTKDGMSVSGDFGVQYTIVQDKVPLLFQKYRDGIDELNNIVIFTQLRNQIALYGSTVSVEDLYGDGKQKMMTIVEKNLRESFTSVGISIEHVYIIGSLRFPQNIIDALNLKNAAVQQAQQRENEVATAKAEAQKQIETARGIAEANKLKMASITPELLRLQELEIQKIYAEKWNGQAPTTVIGSGTNLMYSLPSPTKTNN